MYDVNEAGWWWSRSWVRHLRLRTRQAWCELINFVSDNSGSDGKLSRFEIFLRIIDACSGSFVVYLVTTAS